MGVRVEAKDNEIKIQNKNINKKLSDILKKIEEINLEEDVKIDIWRVLAYFIIYSIVGFVVETTFGIITKGVVESRQSFLYGPFCAVYGLGACVMILSLQKLKKSHNRLFLGGFLIGSVVEYFVSLFGEMIFHVRWWDYSNRPFNINGRICVSFSFFWGVLAMYLMSSFNPRIDKIIDKIKSKFSSNQNLLKIIILGTLACMIIDCIITGIALDYFKIRKIEEYDLNVPNRELITEEYNRVYGNEKLSEFIYKFWNDRKMILTFPNLKIQDIDGKIIFFKDLVGDIEPYYFMVYDKDDLNQK